MNSETTLFLVLFVIALGSVAKLIAIITVLICVLINWEL